MKLSKSILNPIRATRNGGGSISLSFLHGRTNNGSRSSPLSTSGRKRGGGAFENPEPSSPKVTCIGQVRVKSKKRAKRRRSLSQRRSGEASFRKTEQNAQERFTRRHRNQRWVHLPISVCGAVRAFGAEFSCLLFSCRISSCVSRRSEGVDSEGETDGCGAVLGRWLVFSSDGGRREIEVVVGGGDAEEDMAGVRSSRRHVLEDIEVKNGRIEVRGRSIMEIEEEEERGRVSICIPPKNALLVMRCRSDPMKMAALANRCSLEYQNQDIEEESLELEGEENIFAVKDDEAFEKDIMVVEDKLVKNEENEHETKEEETESNMSSFEALLEEDYEVAENPSSHLSSSSSQSERNLVASLPQEEETEEEEKEKSTHEEDRNVVASLPECLVLMMCEPKLSMEVSKETWVRGKDFIRWMPEQPLKPAKPTVAGCDHRPPVGRRPSTDSRPPGRRNDRHDHRLQPPRSSCSLPAAAIERRLGECEPLALTRCKSEPMRTAASKLAPEACFRRNGGAKVGPHGGGAAGIGF